MATASAEPPGVVCDGLGSEISVPRGCQVAGTLTEGGSAGSMDVRLPEPTLMADSLLTNYFLNEVLRKRPYTK